MAKTILGKGIDVSNHQGNIDWNKVKNAGISFVMIRAGYGIGDVDARFKQNIEGASKAGLNVGIYWFSYAHTPDRAAAEADFMLKTIDPYKSKINMPVCFDWEYDSDNYVKKTYGITPDKTLVSNMAKAFLIKVEQAGYYASNYTNIDYLKRFYTDEINNRFDIWVAQWASNCTWTGNYGIWQYGGETNNIESNKIDGISGTVDKDYVYKDYPAWYAKKNGNTVTPTVNVTPVAKPEVKPVSAPSTPIKESVNILSTGSEINLNNVSLYASATSSNAVSKKSGKFYVYSDSNSNGRIRITNSKSNVGKTPAGSYVTGWINVSDLGNSAINVNTPKKITNGLEINLNNVSLYASASSSNDVSKKTGKFYVYNAEEVNKRIRITNSKSNVGKTPAGSYVTGWINVSDI